MRIFVLSTCDTCRKSLKALASAGHTPEVIDVRKDGVSEADLAAMIAAKGDALLNKRSTTWRGLDEAARAQPLEVLLAEHPTLIKRPVIEHDGTYSVGWDKTVQAAFL